MENVKKISKISKNFFLKNCFLIVLTIGEKNFFFELCIETEIRRKFTSEWADVLKATRFPNGLIDIQLLLLIPENCIKRLLGMLD